MNQVLLTSGRKFKANGIETLLDAATRAGFYFPYSCKTGRCSTCKCKVLSGHTLVLHPEVGLTDQEKSEGWILSCVRSAASEVILDVEDLGGVPAVKTLPCRISHLELLASNVIQVKLKLPPTAEFNFLPGQYIEVIGPNGIRRSYSLANGNFEDGFLELHIRAVQSGAMSEYWFRQAKISDLLRLNGPLGTFFLRDIANKDLVFLATGTGIAPVKAILESLPSRPADQRPQSVTVIWGGREPADIYFDVSSITGNFNYVPVLSRADTAWTGARGYVQQQLLMMNFDLHQAVIYACGSDDMIRSAKEFLTQYGLSTNQFFSDAFVCSSS